MNRRDLNRHMHSHHKGAEQEYFLSAVGEAREAVHEIAHTEGVMNLEHTHDDDEDSPAPAEPQVREDRQIVRLLNKHMHWQHGGLNRTQHEAIHQSLLTDHVHEWPLSLVALGQMVDEAKAEKMREHERTGEAIEQRMRTHREQGTQ